MPGKIMRSCAVCGKEFQARTARPGREPQTFCSMRCCGEHRRHPARSCKNPGCSEIVPSLRKNVVYCSPKCRLSRAKPELAERDAVAPRFWSKVNKNGPVPEHVPELGACWVWTMSTKNDGYGSISVGPAMVGAHRFSYELENGPAGDLFVCHKCDNRACVRPDHLFLGTNVENIADRDAKGRCQQGETHARAVLSEASAATILAAYKGRGNGPTQAELARRFGVHPATVYALVKGRTWGGAGRQPSSRVDERRRLPDGAAEEIRRTYGRGGVTQRELADRFGVSAALIGLIARGALRATTQRDEP